jgi:hypothetical protein
MIATQVFLPRFFFDLSLLQVLDVKSQLQWGEQEAYRNRKGSINRALRAEHPQEIDSELWWGVKEDR